MTEQEAMEIIMQVAYDGEFPLNSNEAFGIACKCIVKQIPKKSVLVTRGDGIIKFHPCPSCSTPEKYVSVYPPAKFCSNCGQALKWE